MLLPSRTNWQVTPRGRGGVYRWCCYSYKMPHEPDDGVPWASRGACNNLYPCCSAGCSSQEHLLQEDNLERKITGQMRPVSLFRQIHLQEGNLELKPMPKTDRLSHLLAGARNGSLTHYVNQMVSIQILLTADTHHPHSGAVAIHTAHVT